MEEFLKKNKIKILVALIAVLFSAYIINGINEHSTIPDHIHSIDDKAPEERTDEDNIVILKRILQKDPGNVDVMIQLSDLYIKTGDEKLGVNGDNHGNPHNKYVCYNCGIILDRDENAVENLLQYSEELMKEIRKFSKQ